MFIDESGDHNLQNIDDQFPLFCLCGCVFEKEYYRTTARPLIDKLKIRFWNSMDVILLSRDIRRQEGAGYQSFEGITTLWTEKKRENIVGLQIADLAAYPLARKILDPMGAQLSFDVLRVKICHKPGEASRILGYGIKIFPQATFDHYLYLGGGF